MKTHLPALTLAIRFALAFGFDFLLGPMNQMKILKLLCGEPYLEFGSLGAGGGRDDSDTEPFQQWLLDYDTTPGMGLSFEFNRVNCKVRLLEHVVWFSGNSYH